MTELAPDREQRRRAVSLNSSCIVQAPAGSGKTELLIQRYLALLSAVDHPEEIIAITFTRKAASEMRGRIIEALDAARAGREPGGGDAPATHGLARAALARDALCGWDLAGNPGRLRVQTVDSLCAHLTRQLPILSRFGAQPETIEDASTAREEAAIATLAHLEGADEWSDSIAILLSHLDNDLLRAADLIAAMLARRDQWLEHVLAPRREELEGALRRLVESSLRTAGSAFPGENSGELVSLLAYASRNLEEEEGDSPLADCAGIRDLPGAAARDARCWRAIAGFLLTRNGNWRKRARPRLGFPGGSGDRAAMKQRYEDLLGRLAGNESLRRILADIRILPAPEYMDEDWEVVAALCRVLLLADAELSVVFAGRDQIDFAGVTRAALTALGTEDEPTDLALYLDYQIRHLLVDEFQDISVNQYQLLRMLTAGWSPGDGRTLFLVGDPMQSIYRFREADVGLFLDTWEQKRLGQVPLTPLSISVNFRSVPGIVDWVNRIFAGVLPAVADSARGAVPHARSDAFHPAGAGRAVHLHGVPDSGTEAECVVSLVEDARRSDPHGSVAVLVRNRTCLPEILAALKRQGLRFRAIDIEGLGHRPAIQDLLALTRALHHFPDRIAWLAVLRAPWCGLELSDLIQLCGDGRDTVWDCMCNEARTELLSDSGRQRLHGLRAQLQAVFAERGRRPLRRWVESAWLRIGGPATLRSKSDLLNAETFFQLLHEFDNGGDLHGIEQLAASVQSLFAAPDTEADERLQVLTIHRAKGLEFDTVIAPGLARLRRSDEQRLLLWTARTDASGRRDLLLAPIRRVTEVQAPIYELLARLEKEKQEHEEERLLYVAATRARKELHLVGVLPQRGADLHGYPAAPRSGSMLALLWPMIGHEFPVAPAAVQTATTGSPERRIGRLPAWWRVPEPAPDAPVPANQLHGHGPTDHDPVPFEWAGQTIMHIGTAVHACLHRVGTEGIGAWSADRVQGTRRHYEAELTRLGVPAPELAGAVAQVSRAVRNTLEDERGRWLLDSVHARRRSEWSVSGLRDGRLVHCRVDLSFVDETGARWIIDYKTSRHDGPDRDAFLDRECERYRQQMHDYAALLSEMEDRPIRLGLYFPLMRGWREWAFEGK